MELDSSSNSLSIDGNIKSVSDFQNIKLAIDAMIHTHKSITINIKNSLSITSSVIGYLNKIILNDGINVSMNIGDSQLVELLEDLNLASTFKARKA